MLQNTYIICQKSDVSSQSENLLSTARAKPKIYLDALKTKRIFYMIQNVTSNSRKLFWTNPEKVFACCLKLMAQTSTSISPTVIADSSTWREAPLWAGETHIKNLTPLDINWFQKFGRLMNKSLSLPVKLFHHYSYSSTTTNFIICTLNII